MRGYYRQEDEIEKPKPKNPKRAEEHYPAPDGGQPELHIVKDLTDGVVTDVEVWLNTGTADYDGMCIGAGETRDDAIAQAVRSLEWIVATLQGPPPETAK